MTPSNLTTRDAQIADHADIARLMHQLGYDATPAMIRDKLATLLPSAVDRILVATIAHRVVGCISLHTFALFHAHGNLGRITSLVVDEGCRGQGVGGALIAAAHSWFESVGCVKLEVTSGDHRLDAHRFYARYGFTRDGQRLSKRVRP
ncbi:GNAT family N-acetyltransferase [Burkholderia cenocepacia]|uniref:GNAT family N-acetyltransferase n=1 Tax=Burkholderia cenocepacia TaxID=95486 RepID=UPI00158957F8|nr:GNAT family N-acetyltransferase [Burkholderia cenocepacia]MBR7958549.1 GNAT family N-acetyltransferase [Burkholderia cenocepacia]